MLYRHGRSLAEIKAMAAILERRFGRSDLSKILIDVGPQYGQKVTNAMPGQSAHNYGLALDGVPLRNGKPVWGITEPDDVELWYHYGEAAERVGLEWAGRWTRFREMPHVKEPGFDWEYMICLPHG